MRTGWLVALLLAGSAGAGADTFPFERQAEDFCGEACFAMALKHWGVKASQYQVHAFTGLSPEQGRGAWTREMLVAAKGLWGAGYPSPWVETAGKEGELEARWGQLVEWVRGGTPCMVCCRYDDGAQATEHFRLVTAVDAETGTVTYQEPAEDDGAARTMAKERFLSLWPVRGEQGSLLIVFPLARPPAEAEKRLAEAGELAGRLTQTVRRVRRRVGEGFRLGVQGPFVVVSNQSEADFRASLERTIGWAYTHLTEQFFPGGLRRPIEVYLFDGEKPYTRYAWEWFEDKPSTPFGYYSSAHRALIMNIATGGGTLVHEMVHPLMEEHFPGVPSWFNEGLASLFEQCGERGGKMVGLLNWRYAGLMEAIRTGAFQSLERLMKTTTGQFYSNDQGNNYGIARYLCQYLQSLGKIEAYFCHFKAHYDEDPTGIASLRAVLGNESMEKIQAAWLEWLKGLK